VCQAAAIEVAGGVVTWVFRSVAGRAGWWEVDTEGGAGASAAAAEVA
jgi:hypothetical protein